MAVRQLYARNSVSLADLNLALFSFSDLTITIKVQRTTMRHTFLIIIIFWLIGTGRLLSLRETLIVNNVLSVSLRHFSLESEAENHQQV